MNIFVKKITTWKSVFILLEHEPARMWRMWVDSEHRKYEKRNFLQILIPHLGTWKVEKFNLWSYFTKYKQVFEGLSIYEKVFLWLLT